MLGLLRPDSACFELTDMGVEPSLVAEAGDPWKGDHPRKGDGMTRKVSCLVAALAFAATMLVAAVPAAADTRTAAASGTAAFRETGTGSDELAFTEIRRRVGARGTPVGQLPIAGKRGQFPPMPLANPSSPRRGSPSRTPSWKPVSTG